MKRVFLIALAFYTWLFILAFFAAVENLPKYKDNVDNTSQVAVDRGRIYNLAKRSKRRE